MSGIKETFAALLPALRDEIKLINQQHGDVKISDVTVSQAYGGMRGVKAMVCDTSVVNPDSGLVIRGYPALELVDKLPEEIFWLLFIGKLPTAAELKSLQDELKQYGEVPAYVWDVLEAMPKDSHPMTMFDTAILVMQKESLFAAQYHDLPKGQLWEPMLMDSLQMLARLPAIAAGIYRMRFGKGKRIAPDAKLDWAANYVHMLGLPSEGEDAYKMMRLYLTLHCDHESGNVSANTCHTVGSALSDAYYAVSAGLNGLAGPLHGLANQECLGFVLDVEKKFNGMPTEAQLSEMCWDLLNHGHVIPGYGHAVLRVPDPRFVAFRDFGKKYCADDVAFRIMDLLFEVAPKVLAEHGKAKDPWPNVDAASGTLLYHYGIREFSYYTVLFGVSRAMGMLSQLIINRALGIAITRPKSVSTEWIKKQVGMVQQAQ